MSPHPNIAKLNRVLDRMGGLYTAADILEAVGKGRLQMFCEGDSIAITQIGIFPQGKVLEVIGVVGAVSELRILHDGLIKYAEEVGCKVIQAYGRKGWLGDAARRGWKVKARSFVYQREVK